MLMPPTVRLRFHQLHRREHRDAFELRGEEDRAAPRPSPSSSGLLWLKTVVKTIWNVVWDVIVGWIVSLF